MANQNNNNSGSNNSRTLDLPLYEQIKVIVPKIQIRSYYVPTRSDKCRFSSNFGIAHDDIIKLGQRRRTHYELQLRIFFPEPDKNVVPRVRLNSQDVDLPNQNERAQQNPICVDITPFCIKFGSRMQEIKIEWDSTAEAVCEYTILLVKSRSPDVLIDQMLSNPNKNRPLELTKTAFIEQIKATKAGEFEIGTVKISLIDPLTQKRIGTPARGSDCEHLRCFDLRNFFTINAKSPQATWKCPICEKDTNFAKLIIDEYYENVLKENKADTVEIQYDGTWHVEEEANTVGNVPVAADDEKERSNSSNGISEEKWQRTMDSTESLSRTLNSLEFPFYQQKKMLVPVVAFNSLPNMGFSSCQIEMEKIQAPMELQLRMYLVRDSSEYYELEEFPLPSIHLGKTKVQYTPSHDVWIHEYQPFVVDLTPIFNKQAQKKQNLHMKWDGKEQAWAFSVVLVKRVDSVVLQRKLCYDPSTNAYVSCAATEAMIREQLTSTDDDIQINTMKISLLDSLTRKRIQIPARALNCKHVQCFDLYSYLSMNEMRPVWKCPICNGDANYSKLRIDEYFQKVLEDTENSVEEVEVLHDGTWRPATTPNAKKSLESAGDKDITMLMEKEGDGKADVICLSSDDENEENEAPCSSNTGSTFHFMMSMLRRRKRALAHNNSVAQQVKEEPMEEPAEKRATL